MFGTQAVPTGLADVFGNPVTGLLGYSRLANLPPAGIPGRTVFVTDTKQVYFDNGTFWNPISTSAGVPGIALTSKDVDVSGVSNSLSTINGALSSLPLTGGVVYLPAGNLNCNGGALNFGDGSQAGVSTRQGMILQGVAPAVGWSLSQSGTQTFGPTRLFTTTPGQTLISVNGPLHGWGVRDLFLDGGNQAAAGLDEIACVGGDSRNVTIYGCAIGQHTRTLTASGALASFSPNHVRNFYHNFLYGVRTDVGGVGIYTDGDGVTNGVNDSWGDQWDGLTFSFAAPAVPSSGIFAIGIQLVVCDSQLFKNVVFKTTGVVSGAGNYAVKFNYTNPFQFCGPTACTIRDVDFGTSDQVILWAGTPTGAGNTAANRILGIRTVNGVPPNPGAPLVEWEGVRSKLGPPVAADIPAGMGGLWRDTTGNTTKYYYNNAGAIIASAAFA